MTPATLAAQRGLGLAQSPTPDQPIPLFLKPQDGDPASALADKITQSERVPRRGDIWFVSARSQDPDLGMHRSVGTEIWSNKLAVVISNDKMNNSSGFVQVVYLSTSPRRHPNNLHVRVDFPEPMTIPGRAGESHTSALAFCEQIHAVDSTRLEQFYGEVFADQLDAIDEAVAWSLDLG